MLRSPLLVVAVIGAAMLAACYTGSAVDTNASPSGTTTSTDPTDPGVNQGPGSNIHGLTHLPCEIETFLDQSCWACHGTVPGFGAATTLVTIDDLTAPALALPGTKEGELCLMRMQARSNSMPPAPAGPFQDAQYKVFSDWITAGMPGGHCGEDANATADGGAGPVTYPAGQAPADQPLACSSEKMLPVTNDHSSTTDPGVACIGCHKTNDDVLTVGGTVFTGANEPDNCVGQTGVNVVIIDGKGVTHTLAANASGNFAMTNALPTPYRAMVVRGSDIKEMQTPQTNGDCNSCHHANPTGNDPGRIAAP